MRPIDADAARKQMQKLLDHHLMMCNFSADSATQDCIEILNEAPTIDAVEVVWCGECKHFDSDWTYCGSDVHYCKKHKYARRESEFCSDGERKDYNE